MQICLASSTFSAESEYAGATTLAIHSVDRLQQLKKISIINYLDIHLSGFIHPLNISFVHDVEKNTVFT